MATQRLIGTFVIFHIPIHFRYHFFQGQPTGAYLQNRALSVETRDLRKKAGNHCDHSMPLYILATDTLSYNSCAVFLFVAFAGGIFPIRTRDATVMRRCKSIVRATRSDIQFFAGVFHGV